MMILYKWLTILLVNMFQPTLYLHVYQIEFEANAIIVISQQQLGLNVSCQTKCSTTGGYFPSILFSEAALETNETRLYKDLFENYQKYNHPVLNQSETVKVVFDFQLIRVIDVVRYCFYHLILYDYFTLASTQVKAGKVKM